METSSKGFCIDTLGNETPHQWRKRRGLLTISDHVLEYRAKRHPRGPYRTPLPDDRLP